MVTRNEVIQIVVDLLVTGHDPDATGIAISYDATAGRIVLNSTRAISFTDLNDAVDHFLEDLPPGQYWLVFNKDT